MRTDARGPIIAGMSHRSRPTAAARRLLSAAFVGAAALAAAAPAASAAPGAWTQLPQSERSAQGATAWPLRLSDGTLDVAYTVQGPGGTSADELTALIGRTGAVSAGAPIETGWSGVASAALILQPGGLAAFFGGMHGGDSTDPNQDLNAATAPGAGGPWTVAPGSASATEGVNDDQAYASDVSVVALPDGTPIEAWAHTLAVSVHRGIGAASPNQDFQAALGGCCGYDVDLAVDGASGQPALSWYSGAPGNNGYYVQGVDPATGAPVGSPALVPGSRIGTDSAEPNAHTALTGRPAMAGLFTAFAAGYPVQNRVSFWRFGTAKAFDVSHDGNSVRNVAIAADSTGRLWVAWTREGGDGTLFAARSNPAGTRFDTPVSMALPAGASESYALAASAQADRLDVVGTFGPGPGGAAVALSATQLLPGDDVAVKALSVKAGKPAVAAVTVTDAGVPLAGATVARTTAKLTAAASAASARTNSHGVAKLKLGSFRRTTTVRLKITKAGHATRVVALKVKVR
jgi:hypothetical protein